MPIIITRECTVDTMVLLIDYSVVIIVHWNVGIRLIKKGGVGWKGRKRGFIGEIGSLDHSLSLSPQRLLLTHWVRTHMCLHISHPKDSATGRKSYNVMQSGLNYMICVTTSMRWTPPWDADIIIVQSLWNYLSQWPHVRYPETHALCSWEEMMNDQAICTRILKWSRGPE